MDDLTARWMQLKRLTPTEVKKFHQLEVAAGSQHGLVRGKDGYWYAHSTGYLTGINARLGPYWHRAKSDEDRAAEVASFSAHARKLTYRILDPKNPSYKTDLEALQAADKALMDDDYAINFGSGTPTGGRAALSAVYGERQ